MEILKKLQETKKLKETIEIISERIKDMERDESFTDYSKNLEYMEKNHPEFNNMIFQLRKDLERDGLDRIKLEKRFLLKLKEKLTGTDVYNQKSPYKCPICRESECVCGDVWKDINKPATDKQDDIMDKVRELFY